MRLGLPEGSCGSRTHPSEKSLLKPLFINRRAEPLKKNRSMLYLKLLSHARENVFKLREPARVAHAKVVHTLLKIIHAELQ
jgi:hypothetical protein